MMIEINDGVVDEIVRCWFEDSLELLLREQAYPSLHPDDKKSNKKLIKAIKRLQDYTEVPD
jgi:hypothetical protein